MAYNPKFRKPFRPGDDNARGPGSFKPRYGAPSDERPREGGFDPRGGDNRGFGGQGGFRPRQDWGNRDDRGGQGPGNGGFRPRQDWGNRDDRGGQGGFRPRQDWGNRDDRGGQGGFRPRPAFGADNRSGQAGGQGGFRPRSDQGPDRRPFEPDPRPAAPGEDLLSVLDADGQPQAPAADQGRPPFRPRDDRGGDFRPRREWQDNRGGGYRQDRGPRDDDFQARTAWKRPHGAPLMSDLRDDEMKIVGRNACRTLFDTDPRRLIRLYLFRDLLEPMDDLIKFCRQNKLAYHVVEAEEMERVSDSEHHEGMCMVVKRKPSITVRDYLEGLPAGGPACVVAIDGVANPHNIGAIIRVAAHFGVNALVSANVGALQSGAAARTAEGALEHVSLVGCEELSGALTLLKVAGFTVFATSSHGGDALFSSALPERCVFLLGSEGDGLSEKMLKAADRTLCIPGSGKVESLNVACAASVLLAEYWRAHPVAPSA
jgi:RNA methyltransferase, TrmH family